MSAYLPILGSTKSRREDTVSICLALDRLALFPSSVSLFPSSCLLSGHMGDISAGTLGNRSNNATFVAQ